MAVPVGVFDRYVVVDWSARSSPATGRDSIWIAHAEADPTRGPRIATWNPSTRADAVDRLVEIVLDDRDVGVGGQAPSTLVAIDAGVGFPTGTADALGLGPTGERDEGAWRRIWAELRRSIVDDDRNLNNRFAVASEWNRRMTGGPGPFWGCPPAARTSTLTSTKPPHPVDRVAEWRACERSLRAAGRRPFSCWQLLGAGSVASQSLLAIVSLDRLGERLSRAGVRVDVWPFTTGLRAPERNGTGPRVVVAECWPSFFVVGAGADDGRVRDHRQVVETAAALQDADAGGRLAEWFEPDADPVTAEAACSEEGWIIGVEPER